MLAVAAFLCGTIIGLWRGAIEHSAFAAFAPYYGQTVMVQGMVKDATQPNEQASQRLQLQDIHLNNQLMHGEVWVELAGKTTAAQGESVTLNGGLGKGFGSFQAAMYRPQIVQRLPVTADTTRTVRSWFVDNVRHAIAEPQASLGLGFLIGESGSLPPELEAQLRIAGLTHIVVASGYNLTILVNMARRLLERVSKYLAALTATLMIVGFLLITNLSPSMSRAGLVAGLSLAAWYYGRTIHPLVLLPFAAAITLLFRPAYIWGDIGWYLSFLAFAGVLIIAPLISQYFWGNKKLGIFRATLIETVAAQVATLPLILFVFSQLAVYALPANLVVLPLVPLAMFCTFFAGLAGALIPAGVQLFGSPASVILQYMTSVVAWIAEQPQAQSEVTFTVPLLIGSYLVLILGCLWLWHKVPQTFTKKSK